MQRDYFWVWYWFGWRIELSRIFEFVLACYRWETKETLSAEIRYITSGNRHDSQQNYIVARQEDHKLWKVSSFLKAEVQKKFVTSWLFWAVTSIFVFMYNGWFWKKLILSCKKAKFNEHKSNFKFLKIFTCPQTKYFRHT